MRILVIEDNQDLVDNVFDFMESRGHTVDTAWDGISGLHLALTHTFDVILLDLMLPGLDGFKLCQALRGEGGKDTPILMLTALDSLDDKIRGLEFGADDYVVKPCALEEVETRLRALVRRAQGKTVNRSLQVGTLIFNPDTHTLFREGKELFLTPIPLKILELLMRGHPAMVKREEIEYAIWGDQSLGSDTLRTHIHTLREVVDKPFARPLLRTIRGVGFQLVA
ncbi:MAG: response regulator transcription factor [Magnetococcales bacterium]|nr:response regulator transcription factor [Magnetococcales bacterium]MBF0151345.1 response regulator transcription factor [Magnetococcales bacterium]MBF0172978.1 response regulator transcription factor [Magnetococcales bacterium]MBF0348284.1 response regulator transcription factor [Magnetococcales bacterium]MBF0631943.1 response regulator transcription factor [Magnetococcales bacterium]